VIAFTVYGVAKPGGSKSGFYNAKAKRVIITDASKGAKPWKAEVSAAAQTAMLAQSVTSNGVLVDGPLAVAFTFVVTRPRHHFGKSGILPSAPDLPVARPDVLKLARAVEDACTGIVWRDDAQIVRETLSKVYGEPARCEVEVTPL
jgi:Holliday junction resolvase RusA-like endonuclease